ncbi:MAG: DNA gyrase inhibitor YacG [Planctomycetes bacterium]|nr:DNA gyrase inhibitor YacG [Planctomycetota bacterium]
MPAEWPCPTCGRKTLLEKAQLTEAFPFCSSRCRLRDFGRWIDGGFVVPGSELGDGEDIDAPMDPPRAARA